MLLFFPSLPKGREKQVLTWSGPWATLESLQLVKFIKADNLD
jgi:hypothetical protein